MSFPVRHLAVNTVSAFLVLSGMMLACDSNPVERCTSLDSNPFLPHVNFDGSASSHTIQGWGARGVFSTQDATDLSMEVHSFDADVIAIDHAAPNSAQATLQVVSSGSTEIRVTVTNDCGDSVAKSFSVKAVQPLGRSGDMCTTRPSGQWHDFWPLSTGNWWQFRYEARVADAGGGFRRTGEAILRILSSHCRDSHWEYLATLSYDYVVFLNSQRDQTDKQTIYVDSLLIVEDELGELAIQGFGEVEQLKVRDLLAQRWHRNPDNQEIELFQEWASLDRAESRIILNLNRGPGTIALGVAYGTILQEGWFTLTDWSVASEL
jgi:hypothetical protein